MAQFELHVYRNGNWKRLKSFEDRDGAMSAAIRIKRDRSQSGVKIVRETYNESSKVFETKLIHKWSHEAEKKAHDREIDENHERQRLERRKIRERARSNQSGWQATIKNFLVIAATAATAITGVIVLMVVLRG
jgi:Flp pilus assembly protein TadB